MALIPPYAKENDVFYLKPVSKLPADPSSPWFTKSPIGKNRLSDRKMLKEMYKDAGIAGNYTNHSLHAYGVTKLFQAGCNEKLIQQRTGHRSVEALRQYERTSQSQLLDVSNVMAGIVKPKQIVSSTVTEKSSSVVNTPPKIVLSGCNFTGCSINFSGDAASQTKKDVVEEKCIAEKCLEGLDVDDIFGD